MHTTAREGRGAVVQKTHTTYFVFTERERERDNINFKRESSTREMSPEYSPRYTYIFYTACPCDCSMCVIYIYTYADVYTYKRIYREEENNIQRIIRRECTLLWPDRRVVSPSYEKRERLLCTAVCVCVCALNNNMGISPIRQV